MYKSPIELIYEDIQYQVEEGIYKAVQKLNIKVDREELIKALEYDRGQYYKGYEDAKAERKKGRWILSDDQWQGDVANGNYRFFCSECGKSDLHSKEVTVSFCWNCGADMRGET